MKKIYDFLVEKSNIILLFMIIITIISLLSINKVNIIRDMSEYLPNTSSMKQGIDIIDKEFNNISNETNSIKLMFKDLNENDKNNILSSLNELKYISSIDYDINNKDYNIDNYSLFVINTNYEIETDEFSELEKQINNNYKDYDLIYEIANQEEIIPAYIMIMALTLLFLFLIIMSSSYIEPVIFMVTIGIAVFINMGTNALLDGVSSVTNSVAAILQLVLSIDYSIILMNRYKQELAKNKNIDKKTAMKNAIFNAMPSIASSSSTTIVGLLALIFLNFKIGADMGIVLAKGVFISLICIFTVLPGLILMFDKLITMTKKKELDISTKILSYISYKYRYLITIIFIILFALLYIVKGSTDISFIKPSTSKIDDYFINKDNIIVLYNNNDENKLNNIINEINKDNEVEKIDTYQTTIGKKYTLKEIPSAIEAYGLKNDLNQQVLTGIYYGYFKNDYNESSAMSFMEIITFITDNINQFGPLLNEELMTKLNQAKNTLESSEKQLIGNNYSIMSLETIYKKESEESIKYIGTLNKVLETNLNDYYIISNSAMSYEMEATFKEELNKVSLITFLAIFLIVMITFNSVSIPIILLLLIQGSVYATMVSMNMIGISIYYLALLIVQSILMGATIDYAILFTNYYREIRAKHDIKEAISLSFKKSIHTITTSGVIMVVITFILGYAFDDEAMRQICHIISAGVTMALILILIILPGLLATLDKYIINKDK